MVQFLEIETENPAGNNVEWDLILSWLDDKKK